MNVRLTTAGVTGTPTAPTRTEALTALAGRASPEMDLTASVNYVHINYDLMVVQQYRAVLRINLQLHTV